MEKEKEVFLLCRLTAVTDEYWEFNVHISYKRVCQSKST